MTAGVGCTGLPVANNDQGGCIVKRLFSLSVVALALAVGTSGWMLSTSESQAQTRLTVYKPGTQQYYESRMKTCGDNIKGIYRTQQDGYVHPYGWCLSNVSQKIWK